ncbi:MAG: endo-1,4-beta-xylanase [Phycisphaerae bacterium]|nr:endo-1,4-beta-xylanase [Phycisphaerae bacterium]
MNRRDFLKTTGVGLTTLAMTLPAMGQGDEAQDMLAGADARIDQCRKAQVTLRLTDPSGNPVKASTPIRVEQTKHKFLFGCNIFKLNQCNTDADNEAYAERFSALLNFATLPFYWWNYERNQGQPNDERTREIVKWCRANRITTKGHPLAWNYIQPPWLAKDDPGAAMRAQLKRIARCVETFAGDIDIWDVVNEATHYDRPFSVENAPTLTQAITDMGVGDYVRQAFAAARQAGPHATLLINDYRTDPAYENKVISKLVDSGGNALYDVIGIQSHMHGGAWGAKRTWDVCDTYAKYGVPLHYTETTVVSGPQNETGWKTTAQGEASQAQAVSEFYTTLFSHPAVEAVTWWDFTDQNAWQGAPAGLVRADMSPKPAYDRLMDLVKNKWWTKTQCNTGLQGKIDVTGFLGDYRVSAAVNGRKLIGTFTLDRGVQDAIELKLA